MFEFYVDAVDAATGARAGRWITPHGVVETPAFMPVGTRGSVKGVWPSQLRDTGAQMILANTYHLALRPGSEVVRDLGGLHRFMNWDGPILTDSGGFQVFSLSGLRRMGEQGVVFKSHIDGSLLELTPESAMRIQEELGADVIMCLDECPPHGVDAARLEASVDLTTRWAARCREAHQRADQALFGIVQGGVDPALRERSAKGLLPLDFPGYAIGGLSVGESPTDMYRTLEFTAPLLPGGKPRYLMGVGRPVDLIEAVCRGVDLFDCVMPTRNARNATAFTSRGVVKLRNLKHQRDDGPLDPECACATCSGFSRGYLRHLFLVQEMLGPMLLSVHNLTHYQRVMRGLREAIKSSRLLEFRATQLAAIAGDS
ncbi:MAG: tRNA guanosine(34) transglycosylase Tgt [Planctomyces sp.]|nr:tRNA guanosine(34) transglycosylase Tgt [Planctomyces sp.]